MERSKAEAEGQSPPKGMEQANEESRCERKDQIQVATQGLIILDVGILMGSRSPQVLDEHIAIYPGAQKIMDQIQAVACSCCNPMCAYDAFQGIIGDIAGDSREVAAKFLEDASEASITTPDELRDFFQKYRHNTHKDSWLNSLE